MAATTPTPPPDAEAIVGALAAAAPPGWEQIKLTVKATVLVYNFATEVRLADGRPGELVLPREVKDTFMALRESMYEQDRGTWFSATIELRPGAEPEIFFNYDEDPRWMPPPAPTTFNRDLEVFPRSEEHIPPWLDKLLGEGEELERSRLEPSE
jgi:hypothetical protein